MVNNPNSAENACVVPSLCQGDSNSSLSPEYASKKTVHPAKKWGFTLNNFTKEDICAISAIIKSYCRYGIFASEVAPTTGTPHLQGYFEFHKKRRPIGVFKINSIHFDKKNCSKAVNIAYVKKDGNILFEHPKPYMLELDSLYPWEEEIILILNKPIDDRKIHWYWERKGNAGKTTFMKHIYTHYKDCVILSGKSTDMKNGIVNFFEIHKVLPRIVLIDIPRSTGSRYVSISGIEEIKNMFFFSGKYEGGMVCGKPPHLIVMCNSEPDKASMSKDRWHIVNIREGEESSDEENSDNEDNEYIGSVGIYH